MSDALLRAVDGGTTIVDLGRPLFNGMPQSPNHPAFWHSLPRRHGDRVRVDGGSAANDVIVTGTHVGTHIDALAHVSHDGKLYGGADAAEAGVGGRYMDLGIHTVSPMICRGILLDVPGARNWPDGCPAGYEITPDDLETAREQAHMEIRRGDVVLVRSGWGKKFADGAAAYVGKDTGVPGVGEAGARWLAHHAIRAAGADSIAFEHLAPGAGHGVLPAHRVLLVENGIYLVEALDLEELAERRVREFTFVLVPLKIIGATGSPVRPLAVFGGEPAADAGASGAEE